MTGATYQRVHFGLWLQKDESSMCKRTAVDRHGGQSRNLKAVSSTTSPKQREERERGGGGNSIESQSPWHISSKAVPYKPPQTLSPIGKQVLQYLSL